MFIPFVSTCSYPHYKKTPVVATPMGVEAILDLIESGAISVLAMSSISLRRNSFVIYSYCSSVVLWTAAPRSLSLATRNGSPVSLPHVDVVSRVVIGSPSDVGGRKGGFMRSWAHTLYGSLYALHMICVSRKKLTKVHRTFHDHATAPSQAFVPLSPSECEQMVNWGGGLPCVKLVQLIKQTKVSLRCV